MAEASSGKVPILECVVVSWRFLFDHWSRFAPAAVVVSIVSALSPLVMGALLGGTSLPAVYAAITVSELAGVFFTAAVLRYAVRREFIGPAGLGFGLDEGRLIGALACLTLLFVPLIFLVGMVWAASIFGGLGLSPEELDARAKDPVAFNDMIREAMTRPPDASVQIVGIIAGLLALYVLTRLSMANAATIGERRFVFFQTWGWAKGNILRILAAIFVTALPPTLLNLIIGSALSGVVVAGDNPGGAAVYVVLETLRGLIANLANIPFIALGAHLYRGLKPTDFAAR